MRRIAIPVFQNQLATVLDYSDRFIVISLDGDRLEGRLEIPVGPESPETLVRALEGFKVDVVICGAVSGSLLESLARKGIEVITCVRGTVDRVIAAYTQGKLADEEFRLPGHSPPPRDIPAEAGHQGTKRPEWTP